MRDQQKYFAKIHQFFPFFTFNSLLRDQVIKYTPPRVIKYLSILSCEISVDGLHRLQEAQAHFQFSLARSALTMNLIISSGPGRFFQFSLARSAEATPASHRRQGNFQFSLARSDLLDVFVKSTTSGYAFNSLLRDQHVEKYVFKRCPKCLSILSCEIRKLWS